MKNLFFLLCFVTSPFLLSQVFAQPPDMTDVRFLPGDATIGVAAGDQSAPVIFKGGDQFLVVWVDERTDVIPNLIGDEGMKDIYAIRLDDGGNPVDAVPIVVNQEGGTQDRPVVAWNGENWLVVWVNQESTQFYYTDQIVASRISPAGLVLDPQPIPLVTFVTTGNGELYDVTSDGANWVVSWKDYVSNQWRIQGVRVSPQGIVLDPSPVTLHTTQSQPYQGRMSFAQNEYFLVWKEWRSSSNDDLLARRFNQSLQQLETNAFLVTSHADYDTHPDVVTNGTDFFVVWERYNTCCVGGGGKVYGARVNLAGTVLDPNGIAISGYVGETIGRAPTVAWSGTNYFVGWVLSYDLYAARVSSGGSVLDPAGFAVGTGTALMYDPDIAGDTNGGALMTWQDNRAGGILPFDIYKATISPAGVVGNEGPISSGAPTQTDVDAEAYDGGYMIVYRSELSGIRRIMAQPLDANGDPTTAGPVLLASGPQLDDPAVAWNGSLFLVTWAANDIPQISGMRIAPDGSLIDAVPFAIMAGITPDVAALGDTFLVVGTHNPNYFEFRHPYAVRVRGSDRAILDATPRQLGQYFAQNPSVSTLDGRWIATWQRNMSHDDPDANINAAFIAANGTPTTEFIVSGTTFWELYTPAVASSGSNALIVWRDSRNGYPNIDIYGRIILPNGSMQAEFGVATELEWQNQPAVAWDGIEYVVAYQDRRNIPYFFDTRSDIYATRVDESGSVLDPDGFAVDHESVPEISPAVTGGDGVALFVSSLFQSQNPFTSYRAGYRFTGLDQGIACNNIFFFNAKCNANGAAQAMVKLQGDFAGQTVTFELDGEPQIVTLMSNGTNSIGKMTVPHAGIGAHTVALTNPAGCYSPVTFSCQVDTPPDPEWDAMWAEYDAMEQTAIPAEVRILGNYPNPFNPTTNISYAINADGFVSLKVYNSLGEEVAALVNEFQAAGYKMVTWNGRNDAGASVASGLYFYRLTAGNEVRTAKMMLMK